MGSAGKTILVEFDAVLKVELNVRKDQQFRSFEGWSYALLAGNFVCVYVRVYVRSFFMGEELV